MNNKPKVSTTIRPSLNGGHQVSFTIDNQTFYLQELFDDENNDEGMTSKKYAEWYEKQLKAALDKLL